MSAVTVTPKAPRLEWVEPCPVTFGYDAQYRRYVKFGTGRYGTHNVTVNGVKGEMASFRWIETERGRWKREANHGSNIRRHEAGIDYLSNAACLKVMKALEPLVTRLAEQQADEFGDHIRSAAGEQSTSIRSQRDELVKAATAKTDQAELCALIESGEAEIRPARDRRRCSIDPLNNPASHMRETVAEILTPYGLVGWAVHEKRSAYSGSLVFVPEHLVVFL